jgi:hypothetical protein
VSISLSAAAVAVDSLFSIVMGSIFEIPILLIQEFVSAGSIQDRFNLEFIKSGRFFKIYSKSASEIVLV